MRAVEILGVLPLVLAGVLRGLRWRVVVIALILVGIAWLVSRRWRVPAEATAGAD